MNAKTREINHWVGLGWSLLRIFLFCGDLWWLKKIVSNVIRPAGQPPPQITERRRWRWRRKRRSRRWSDTEQKKKKKKKTKNERGVMSTLLCLVTELQPELQHFSSPAGCVTLQCASSASSELSWTKKGKKRREREERRTLLLPSHFMAS